MTLFFKKPFFFSWALTESFTAPINCAVPVVLACAAFDGLFLLPEFFLNVGMLSVEIIFTYQWSAIKYLLKAKKNFYYHRNTLIFTSWKILVITGRSGWTENKWRKMVWCCCMYTTPYENEKLYLFRIASWQKLV